MEPVPETSVRLLFDPVVIAINVCEALTVPPLRICASLLLAATSVVVLELWPTPR